MGTTGRCACDSAVPVMMPSGVAIEFAVHPLQALVVEFRLRISVALVFQCPIRSGPRPNDAPCPLDAGAGLSESRGRYIVGRTGQLFEFAQESRNARHLKLHDTRISGARHGSSRDRLL